MRRHVPATLGLALMVMSCGGSITERATQTLTTTLAATNAARDEFVRWDKDHQLEIVDSATSLEDGKDKLAAYRKKRQRVVQSFAVAYGAIATAAATIPLVEAGKAPADNLATLLIEGINAVRTAINAYKDIRDAFDPTTEHLSPAEAAAGAVTSPEPPKIDPAAAPTGVVNP